MASPVAGLARNASLTPTTSATTAQVDNQPPVKVIRRGTDILTVVHTQTLSESAESLNTIALQQPEMPRFTPDGAGVILIFHTERGNFVLGGLRDNPALSQEKTRDGTRFPKQISTTVGGYLVNAQQPFKQSVLQAVRTRFLLGDEQTPHYKNPDLFSSWHLLENLCHTIGDDEGWGNQVCVHTDHWKNSDNSEGTMCYMTAVKHLQASFAQLAAIEGALGKLAAHQAAREEAPRVKMEFKFVALEPVVKNSLASYRDDEITKARNAYEHFQGEVVVTFNDLAMATLAENHALQQTRHAILISPNQDTVDPGLIASLSGLSIQTSPEDKILARNTKDELASIVKRFQANRTRILSEVERGSGMNADDAVQLLKNSCHASMIDAIDCAGNLNVARDMLASTHSAIVQIDQLYKTVPFELRNVFDFPSALAAKWNALDNKNARS